jgi:hypothetical protein
MPGRGNEGDHTAQREIDLLDGRFLRFPFGFAANQDAGASNGNNGARAAILGKRRLLDEL